MITSAKLTAQAELSGPRASLRRTRSSPAAVVGLKAIWAGAISKMLENPGIYVPTEAGLPILDAGKRP